jgi:hypothetical protein
LHGVCRQSGEMSGDKVAYVTADEFGPDALGRDHVSGVEHRDAVTSRNLGRRGQQCAINPHQPAVIGNGGDTLDKSHSGNRIPPCPYRHIAHFVEGEIQRGHWVSPVEEALSGSVVDVIDVFTGEQNAGIEEPEG